MSPHAVVAIRLGSVPMVEALLKNKADPNVRDVDTDWPPLLRVFERGDVGEQRNIINLLLAAGADVNAAGRNEGDLLKGVTPLMFATEAGSEDIVQLLLDRGADVNAKSKSGFTAISMAKSSVFEDHASVIRKLLAAGAKE